MSWSIDQASAYGGVLIDQQGQVLLREPANHYDGYVWTFAKGRQDAGETPEQTALREVREETGYQARIVGVLPGVFKGGTTANAYFIMQPLGPQEKTEWETQATRWVGFDEAHELIGQTTNAIGRTRDREVLAAARNWLEHNRPSSETHQQQEQVLERFQGCLLGGAVGDALGAPVEFMSRQEILDRFGLDGITRYARAFGGLGRITDDTQMTLFTAEGLLRGWVRGCQRGITTYAGVTANAYLRWLRTQGLSPAYTAGSNSEETGWLYSQPALHSQRAPGHTCLSALQEMQHLGKPAQNNSKGCGGVMRVAPVGLFGWRLGQCASPEQTFELGTELAALTHGHPTGALTGGVLAVLILQLADGATLTEALEVATTILRQKPHHMETLQALEHAQALSASGLSPDEAIARLGKGWIAEEALAIAVYCALVARDFRHGVVLAVNHDGDSDSTGAIAGNLLGTLHGLRAIPQGWLSPLELHDVIQEMACDLYAFKDWDMGEYSQDSELVHHIWRKYPGC